jgi:hypothetical protein
MARPNRTATTPRSVAIALGHQRTTTVSSAGPAGRRVRHRLTPTGRGQRPTVAPICPTGDGLPHLVGARRCLARPRHGRGNPRDTPARGDDRNRPATGVRGVIAGPPGPAGQAPPDPYRAGRSAEPWAAGTLPGKSSPSCRGEAAPRPPRRMARQNDTARSPPGTLSGAPRRRWPGSGSRPRYRRRPCWSPSS